MLVDFAPQAFELLGRQIRRGATAQVKLHDWTV